MQNLVEGLNQPQEEAVTIDPCNVLVLAGAGSGKTRVLVHRIAWLLSQRQVSPYNILAVTFTNKAAAEMCARIEEICEVSAHSMWVGTFHGLAHRLLRTHSVEAKLADNFQVIDSEDQYRIIRRAMKNLNIDEKQWPPRSVQSFINSQKDQMLRSHQLEAGNDYQQSVFIGIYREYENLCTASQLVDFAELLLRSYDLLSQNPDVLAHYRTRFSNILVDEFQDTNQVQYAWLKLLKSESNCFMAVGDDDQSIYSWRGAKVENLRRFKKDFNPVKLVRLEQNYRSSKTILAVANAIIAHNSDRIGKQLWSAGDAGDKIHLYAAFNETDEAKFICNKIKQARGLKLKDNAILYRSNAQSRVLEEALIAANIPYRIYGGLRFFERAEIKNALAYLRLMVAPNDNYAFERIVNFPARGIGERSVDLLRQMAVANGTSIWQAAEDIVHTSVLTARAKNAIQAFTQYIKAQAAELKTLDLAGQVRQVVDSCGLLQLYKRDLTEQNKSRIENLKELVTAAAQFEVNIETPSSLVDFLSHASLEAGETQAEQNADYVQLMTLHSSKGLEFKTVFLCGMENGLFPSQQSLADSKRLAEERRLCYVGVTRAKQNLYLTYAEGRRIYGQYKQLPPSRFIREIPSEFINEIRTPSRSMGQRYGANSYSAKPKVVKTTSAVGVSIQGSSWYVGDRVKHNKFGDGMILNHELTRDAAHPRLYIRFADGVSRWLDTTYAKLEKITKNGESLV